MGVHPRSAVRCSNDRRRRVCPHVVHGSTQEGGCFVSVFVTLADSVARAQIAHHEEMAVARQRLTEHYGLGDDPDVLFGRADELYASMRFAECYRLTSKFVSSLERAFAIADDPQIWRRILAVHSSHRPTLPIHLSCMHHLPHLRSRLFLLAHELVESEPDDCISWYAVGLWYFAGRRWEESRRFFGCVCLSIRGILHRQLTLRP